MSNVANANGIYGTAMKIVIPCEGVIIFAHGGSVCFHAWCVHWYVVLVTSAALWWHPSGSCGGTVGYGVWPSTCQPPPEISSGGIRTDGKVGVVLNTQQVGRRAGLCQSLLCGCGCNYSYSYLPSPQGSTSLHHMFTYFQGSIPPSHHVYLPPREASLPPIACLLTSQGSTSLPSHVYLLPRKHPPLP